MNGKVKVKSHKRKGKTVKATTRTISKAKGTSAMRPSGGHPGEEFAKKTLAKAGAVKSNKKFSSGNPDKTKGTISKAPGTSKIRPSGGH